MEGSPKRYINHVKLGPFNIALLTCYLASRSVKKADEQLSSKLVKHNLLPPCYLRRKYHLLVAMYWPCGVPRIYAFRGPANTVSHEDPPTRLSRQSNGNIENKEKQAGLLSATKGLDEPDQASSSVIDLKASRNDQIFTTITEVTLAVWQSRVCL